MPNNCYMIIGLGNPGREYRETRHNLGFMVVDRLAVRFNLSFRRLQFKSLIASTDYLGNKVILVKPQTYMNLSGQSVSALVRFYKISLSNMIVAHDHLDLPLGTIRIRSDGGAGGQRGMESIIERLGSKIFPRIRLGIDRPPGQMDPANFVLQEFHDRDMIIVSQLLDRAADAIITWMEDGLETAMNRFNSSELDAN